MGLDPRKRQKKLERRALKQKEQKKALAKRDPRDVAVRLERSITAPILHTCGTRALWDQGIGYVLVSRELASGSVAFVMFLVDMYCLGVKDALYKIASRTEYDRDVYHKAFSAGDRVPLRPACARKLVEGAVEYARDLGIAPHRDYQKAQVIFGDIDTSVCSEEFEYGREGKPFFIAGPYDSPARCRQIAQLLVDRCGLGGADYLVPVARDSILDTLFLEGGEEVGGDQFEE